MGRPFVCRYCRGTRTRAKGTRATAAGPRRIRYCNDCKRKFTVGPKLPPAAPKVADNGQHDENR